MFMNEKRRVNRRTVDRQTEVANDAIESAQELSVEGFDKIVATRPIVELAADNGTTLAGLYRPDRNGHPINSYEELITAHTLPVTTEVLFNGKTGLVLGINHMSSAEVRTMTLEEKIVANIELTPAEIAFVLGRLALNS
jgi:hypothetical protein